MMQRASKPQSGTLVAQVSNAIRASILSGEYVDGEKLPSESRLTEIHKVSRTVIREAVATLRADRLVEVKHGAGVFVRQAEALQAQPFKSVDYARLSSILEVLELRAAIETEAAGLAALRRSPVQEEDILRRLQEFDSCVEEGRPTSQADFDLHLSIALAANNPRFAEYLEIMGRSVIPRAALQSSPAEHTSREYLRQIQQEHLEIVTAISDGDSAAARDAMRRHLRGSEQRYKAMLRNTQP